MERCRDDRDLLLDKRMPNNAIIMDNNYDLTEQL